ncbi:6-carboxyhexanoate--CoA ligase [Comamonas serinivorans]|uniref:6-carboxyhexanoate--CoA ligase n=1 Tax=Comamonas serinivorans TaxID=1082851 RepID=A0A1Y0ESN6_9BURK|nr:acetate--CoA ligase family protein [Comamonas serinivorans]ARU06684.1 6-carboxyhexanoate--CoA ligase [Comamonas serinivorans]
MLDSVASLGALFSPRAIAVVGASSNARKIGGIPVDYLQRFGYGGDLYPVNPTTDEVQGLQAFPSLAEIGRPVDLAILSLPAPQVPQALTDAAEAGVKAAVMFSSGFAETGEQGAAAQARVAAQAREAGIRLIGPNCLGVMNLHENVYATFSPAPGVGRAQAGRIGLVSQSGAFGAYAYSMARERRVGLSIWATTGNEADVQVADCLQWLAQDPGTDVIMAYMEGCRDGERLRQALATAQQAGKPVVMVKVGTTALGAQAAASHTAAIAGDDRVYDALFRQYGVMRARNLTEFFDLAYVASVAGRPQGQSIGLFTVSGGVGALMADEAAQQGLTVPELSPAAQQTIREWVPFAAPRNPVDITGQVTNDPSLIERAAHRMLADQPLACWMGFFAAAGASDGFWPVLKSLVVSLRAAYPETVLAISTLLSDDKREELAQLNCLSFDDPCEGIRALAALMHAGASKEPGVPQPARVGRAVALPAGPVAEPEALAVLRQAGVPVVDAVVVRSAAEATNAVRALAEQGQDAVLKVVSADLPHKSDVGGVVLRVTPDRAEQAYRQVMAAVQQAAPQARCDGVLVAPCVTGGVECIAGVHRDPVFGPVLMVGMGGVHVETLQDVALRLLPTTRAEVHAMVRELKGWPILAGARGRPPVDDDGLVDALLALADLALAAGDRLSAVEVNPLIARPRAAGGCVAVDALLTLT